MQFPESWLREFCNPPISTDATGRPADHGRPRGRGDARRWRRRSAASWSARSSRPCSIPTPTSCASARSTPARCRRTARCRSSAARPTRAWASACRCDGRRRAAAAEEDGKPFKIGVGKLRGVESYGMLCSARELKLADDHGGLLELPADTPVGIDVREALKLDDTLFTLKLTPNLAHNLSVLGVAREVSALTGAPLNLPAFTPVKPTHDDQVPVRIEAPDLCGRWAGRVVHGVNPKATTPAWIVDRLARCGQRSVSPLVDISNYVMFELGRPSHIFDHAKIHDELVIRWARPGETLKLLNGNTVTLDEQGRRGGRQRRPRVAGRHHGRRRHGRVRRHHQRLRRGRVLVARPPSPAARAASTSPPTPATASSAASMPRRFPQHIERITQLILDICGGQAGPLDDVVARLPERPPVTLRVARAAKVIGMPVTQEECAGVMKRLGLPYTEGRGHDHRHAAELALRPADRGRPDRGGDPRARLRPPARHPAHRAGDRARAPRVQPLVARGAPRRRRARLPGDDQLQLRRGALGARAGRQRRPDQGAQPDRRAAGRDALQPRRQPGADPAQQPGPQGAARAHLRDRPRVPARRVRRVDADQRGRRVAAAARGRPGLGPGRPAAMGRGRAPRRLLRRQGRRRAAARAARRHASSPPSIRRCTRAAARR